MVSTLTDPVVLLAIAAIVVVAFELDVLDRLDVGGSGRSLGLPSLSSGGRSRVRSSRPRRPSLSGLWAILRWPGRAVDSLLDSVSGLGGTIPAPSLPTVGQRVRMAKRRLAQYGSDPFVLAFALGILLGYLGLGVPGLPTVDLPALTEILP